MIYTIKDLQKKWINKNLIYEALKLNINFSKQFIKNKRVFNENDFKVFQFYKQFGAEKTLKEFWKRENLKDSLETVTTVLKNSSKTVNDNYDKEQNEAIKTVSNKKKELEKIIAQKDELIKVKDEQAQKYALLKQEEKKEKEEWIKKYDTIQKEKGEWMKNYYQVKMYMIIFWILLFLAIIFEIARFFI